MSDTRRGVHVRMRARDVDESHRASSPLELLFDLTFVVAIAQLAYQLAHGIAEGHALDDLGPYLMVFFAIWWAWMNFTWFASGYDTDDAVYRVLTVAQMAGVLILAAGVPAAFEQLDYRAITIGYLVMRLAFVAQWLRAAFEDPATRRVALRYALGIAVVQAGWLLRLLLPESLTVPAFLVLALAEVLVPLYANRAGSTPWHPHHIAERYGLFVIILLGESVLAATNGVQAALADTGVTPHLVVLGLSGLVLLVGLWWTYFLEPAGDGLAQHRQWSYFWGYGHYLLFAALAAVGAGLEVAVEAISHHLETSDLVIGYAVAIPVAIVLVVIWVVHAPFGRAEIPAGVLLPGAGLVLLAPLAVDVVGVAGVVAAIALVVALIVAVTTYLRRPVTR